VSVAVTVTLAALTPPLPSAELATLVVVLSSRVLVAPSALL